IKKLAVFPEALMMRDSITGDVVTQVPIGAEFLKRFKYPYGVIHRADLHRVLLEACQASDLINLRTSLKVTAFEDQGDAVIAKTQQGQECKGAALIGCDGLWSTVRPYIVQDKPIPAGHITYRAVLPTSEMPEWLRWWQMVIWAGEKTHLVQYPVRGGELFNLV